MFRRRTITLTVAFTLAFSLLSTHAAQATVARPSQLGDAGSGAPPIPVVLPGTRIDASARAFGRSEIVWSDLDRSTKWAKEAINYVGAANEWMRDFAPNPDGTYPFQPNTIETRKYFARAVVMALAPTETVDPSITFADLDPSDAFYPAANIAVKLHWMKKTAAGTFAPDKPVTTTMVHRVLTMALGLGPAIKSLNHLHTADGVTFALPANFGALILGMRLGLRYNSSTEANDVAPTTPLSRAQVAYSLYRAVDAAFVERPVTDRAVPGHRAPDAHPGPAADRPVGRQVRGLPVRVGRRMGVHDVVVRANGPGLRLLGLLVVAPPRERRRVLARLPPRPYVGWDLPQRTSADMATIGKLPYDKLRPGDLMFYDGDGDGRVDHVDTFIGNGWALDSSSTPGGVTIMWVGDGWYRDHFVHGRRVLPDQTV